MHYYYS